MSGAKIITEEVLLCPVCKGKGRKLYNGLHDRLYQSPGVWSYSQCMLCNSLWLNPRPCREEIYKCYVEYFTHSDISTGIHNIGESTSNLKREKILDGLLLRRYKERELYYKMRLLTTNPPGRLLDVGCGDGAYLNFMRSIGWDVMGCEPDPLAARIAKERFGLHVMVGMFEDLDMESNSFDAITLSHVIEHTPDPYIVFRRCFNLLRNGGMLALITPNIRSLGYFLFDDSWYSLDPPRHLVLFSPETLRRVLQNSGFRIIMSKTSAWYANDIFGASSSICSNGRVVRMARCSLLARSVRILNVFIEHYGNMLFKNIGEEIGILALKEEEGND